MRPADDQGATKPRTLVILRHAKAARPLGVRDRDRPLTSRGQADSTAAGNWLARRGYLPDLVLCSPATRARQTWDGVRPAVRPPAEVLFPDEVYEAPVQTLAQLMSEISDDVGCVLLIGHNPAASDLSTMLDPAGTAPDGLRTAGIAVHTLPGSWSQCGPGSALVTDAHVARG